MAWDRRGYLYVSERSGRRVRRRYIGKGEIARFVAYDLVKQREFRAHDAYLRRLQRHWQEEDDDPLADLGRLCRLAFTTAMLAAGFHAPRRQWRRKRTTTMPTTMIAVTAEIATASGAAKPAVPRLTREEAEQILHRFTDGETALLPQVRVILASDAGPHGLAALWGGDLTAQVAHNVLHHTLHELPDVCRESITARFRALRAELRGERPTVVEVMLADRAAVLWLQLHAAEMHAIAHDRVPVSLANYHSHRCERLNRQMLGALRSLSQVRGLALPILVQQMTQINVTM